MNLSFTTVRNIVAGVFILVFLATTFRTCAIDTKYSKECNANGNCTYSAVNGDIKLKFTPKVTEQQKTCPPKDHTPSGLQDGD